MCEILNHAAIGSTRTAGQTKAINDWLGTGVTGKMKAGQTRSTANLDTVSSKQLREYATQTFKNPEAPVVRSRLGRINKELMRRGDDTIGLGDL